MTQKTLEERVANRRETHNLYSNIRAELDRLARQVRGLERLTPNKPLSGWIKRSDVLQLIQRAKK